MEAVRKHVFFVAFIVLILCSIYACDTTPEKIDVWADSVNGETRIAQAISNADLELSIRVYGVIKLIKVRQFDLLLKTLKSLPKADRSALFKASAPEIGKMFTVPDLSTQAAGKDMLYLLMTMEQKAVQKSAQQAILHWYEKDFLKKYSAGKFSAHHVLTQIGPAAGDLLVKLMESEPKGRVKVAKIVAEINDPQVTSQVSDYFLTQLKEQTPDLKPDLLQVICYARDDRVTEFLNHYVVEKKNPLAIRLNAFNTLTFLPSKLTLPAATRIFIDRNESIDMRGIAIELLQKIGDESILKYLYPFLKDQDVKWATFAAILKVGGETEIGKILDSLNPRVTFWRGDYDVARRHLKELSPKVVEQLVGRLKSRNVPIVALALIGLQYTADIDVAEKHIKPLSKDKRNIKNYLTDKTFTIGMMATEIYNIIKSNSSGSVKKTNEE